MSSGREKEVRCAHIGVHTRPLRVVENVECLGAELNLYLLLGFEDLVYRHVEVRTVGIVQTIPSGVAKG